MTDGIGQFASGVLSVAGQAPEAFALATTAWLTGNTLAFCMSRLFYCSRLFRELLLATAALFGLMPLIMIGSLLNFVNQPSFSLASWTMYPIEWAAICVSALFPALDALGEELRRVNARYGEIMRLANMSPTRQFSQLAIPHLVPRLLASAKSTLPYSVLLVVVFQFGRGKGLGREVANVIQSGNLWSRLALILVVASAVWVMHWLLERAKEMYGSRFSTEYDPDWAISTLFKPASRNRLASVSGWMFALALYLVAWHGLISHSGLRDYPTTNLTPYNFVESITTVDWSAHPWSYFPWAALLTMIEGMTFALVGVTTACVVVALAENRMFRSGVRVISSISQTIPIFLFIPIYQLILNHSFILVALLVGTSVTFFQGYELLSSRMSSVRGTWMDLRKLMLPHEPLTNYLRARAKWTFTQVWYYAKEVLPIVLPQGIMAAVVLEMFVGIDLRVVPGLAGISFQPQGIAALSYRTERGNLLMTISTFNTLMLFIAVLYLMSARMRRVRESG